MRSAGGAGGFGLGGAGGEGAATGGGARTAPGFAAAVDGCAWPGLGLWAADGCPCLAGASISAVTAAASVGAAAEAATGAVVGGAVGAAACGAAGATAAGVGAGAGVGAAVGAGVTFASTGTGGGCAGDLPRCRASHTPPAAPSATPTTARISFWFGRARAGRSPNSDAAASSQPRGTNSVSDARSAGLASLRAACAWAPPISRV